MKQDVQEILFSEEVLTKRIKELASDISKDYKGKDLIVIGILRGAIFFMTDLLKEIELPLTIDFISIPSISY